jgi:hypothetical protein
MPIYRTPQGFVHIKMTNTKKRPAPAPCIARIPNGSLVVGSTMRCCAISSLLCDWELADGKTCDAPLCTEHAHEIGHDRHLCPIHLAQHRDSAPELF